MDQPLLELGRTRGIDATQVDATGILFDLAIANGAMGRPLNRLCAARAFLFHHAHDLGNDLTRLLDDHGIFDANVEPIHLVEIMERGVPS